MNHPHALGSAGHPLANTGTESLSGQELSCAQSCSIGESRGEPFHDAGGFNAEIDETFEVGYQLGRVLGEPSVGVIDDAAFLVLADVKPIYCPFEWCAPVDDVPVNGVGDVV